MNKRREKPPQLGDVLKKNSDKRRPKMSSKALKTVDLKMSWNNIQDAIASVIYPIAKGKISSDDEIISIKLDYKGGFVSQDKIIPVEVITRKGVSKINLGS
jgi:hypothetical protein